MKPDEIKVAQRTLTLPKWMLTRLAEDAVAHGRTFSGEVREIVYAHWRQQPERVVS